MVGWGSLSCFRRPHGHSLLTGRGCSCNGQVTGKIRLPGLKGPGDIYITTLLLPPSPFQAAASREPAWVAMCRRRRQSWDLLSKTSHHKAIGDSLRRADQRATLSCIQGRNHRVPIPALRQSQTCSDVSTQGWAKMPQRRTTAKKSSSLQQLAGRPLGNCCLALMGVSSEQLFPPTHSMGLRGLRADPRPFQDAGSRLAPLGVRHFVLHSACLWSQGDKTFVCNPGKQSLRSAASPGTLAPTEGPEHRHCGARGARGWRPSVARARGELRGWTEAAPEALSPLHCPCALGWYRFVRAHTQPFLCRHSLNGSLASFCEDPRQLAGNTRSKILKCESLKKLRAKRSGMR